MPICGSQEMPLCLSTSQSLKILLDNIKVSKYTPPYTHIFWFEMTIIFMCKYQYLYRIFSIDAYKRVAKDNAFYMHVFRSQKCPSVYAIVRISKYAFLHTLILWFARKPLFTCMFLGLKKALCVCLYQGL